MHAKIPKGGQNLQLKRAAVTMIKAESPRALIFSPRGFHQNNLYQDDRPPPIFLYTLPLHDTEGESCENRTAILFCKFAQKQHFALNTSLSPLLQTDTWKPSAQMHVLYDSDAFVVLRILVEHPGAADATSALPRHGFEIVDKRAGKELYLDGAWAEFFQHELNTWEATGVTQDDIESALERYAQLAQFPVLLH